ncbi:T6SS phospholipase effector Tle1-like catalytic domain-containing protein, partial [Aliikangiella maris]
ITNVAKMEHYVDVSPKFEHSLSVYIEGIGTRDLEKDSTVGYAFGTQSTGVKKKVEKGITETLEEIKSVVKEETVIDKLVIDVFGFSRGAAAARYYIYQAVVVKKLLHRLRAESYQIATANLSVAFVGLYDTVASEGLSHANDTRSLKLDAISHVAVKKVIHLVAADEHRANFSLTNIKSAGSRGKEIFLPGVHSDIGGSYAPSSDEVELEINHAYSHSALEQDRAQLIDEGWYYPNEIAISSPPQYNLSPMSYHQGIPPPPAKNKLLVTRRHIRHDYDKIPLHIMAEFAKAAGMVFLSSIQEESIPSRLMPVYDSLLSYAQNNHSCLSHWFQRNNPDWLRWLRHDYCHYSAHYTLVGGLIAANKPNIKGNKRGRKIYAG